MKNIYFGEVKIAITVMGFIFNAIY
jgi:hypothetical protein